MHRRRRSSWKTHSWTTPKSWVRETWNASWKTRGQMSSPCPPLRPGRLLRSSIPSTKIGHRYSTLHRVVEDGLDLRARRMRRPQWCLWVPPKACSSPTITDSWGPDAFLLHQQLPEYLRVFFRLVFLNQTITQRQAAFETGQKTRVLKLLLSDLAKDGDNGALVLVGVGSRAQGFRF